MKMKSFILGSCLFISTTVATLATQIPVPNGNFNITNTLNAPPLLAVTNNTIGAWNVSFFDAVALNSYISSGLATALGGPTPLFGSYELDIHEPVTAVANATISQVLTNAWQANSTYTLSLALAQSTTLALLQSATVSLQAGTTNLATLSGTYLAGLMVNANVFTNATLVFKTSNVVPTNGVGITITVPSVALLGGDIYISNVRLSVVPTQLLLTTTFTNQAGTPYMNFKATGGASGEAYNIITTTNLLTTSAWPYYGSGTCDANGNANFQVPVTRTTPYQFFRTVFP